MEWYIPLTILPAIALIILSTSNFLVALDGEILLLSTGEENIKHILAKKVRQLKRLGLAISLLYLSSLFFMFSALAQVLFHNKDILKVLMVIAVIFVTMALIVLLLHSLKAMGIRQALFDELV